MITPQTQGKIIHADKLGDLYLIKTDNDYVIEEAGLDGKTEKKYHLSEFMLSTYAGCKEHVLFQWILFIASTNINAYVAERYANFAMEIFTLIDGI